MTNNHIFNPKYYWLWYFYFITISNKFNYNFKHCYYTSIILIFVFIVKIIVISFSLSIYILNSNKNKQIKNQYLWLFLYFLGFDIFGFTGMLLLIRNNRIEKKEINSKIVIIKNDKNILLWAVYASIGLCCFVLFAPIAIINLIKIKKQWNNKQISQDELKKIIFYSGFLVLLIGRPYTKNVILMNQE